MLIFSFLVCVVLGVLAVAVLGPELGFIAWIVGSLLVYAICRGLIAYIGDPQDIYRMERRG